jgi:hypothetical protein
MEKILFIILGTLISGFIPVALWPWLEKLKVRLAFKELEEKQGSLQQKAATVSEVLSKMNQQHLRSLDRSMMELEREIRKIEAQQLKKTLYFYSIPHQKYLWVAEALRPIDQALQESQKIQDRLFVTLPLLQVILKWDEALDLKSILPNYLRLMKATQRFRQALMESGTKEFEELTQETTK